MCLTQTAYYRRAPLLFLPSSSGQTWEGSLSLSRHHCREITFSRPGGQRTTTKGVWALRLKHKTCLNWLIQSLVPESVLDNQLLRLSMPRSKDRNFIRAGDSKKRHFLCRSHECRSKKNEIEKWKRLQKAHSAKSLKAGNLFWKCKRQRSLSPPFIIFPWDDRWRDLS